MTNIPLSTGYTRSLLLAAGNPNRKTERDYTFEALNAARQQALRLTDDQLKHDRTIILSDVHKGDRQPGTDDFAHNEQVYCEALRYYLDHDYRLILNGDIEEGWKNNYADIIAAYESTAFALEREFALRDRYVRIYGNHDQEWANPLFVQRTLTPVLGRPIRVYPAVFLGDRLFIVHGHQGELNADRRAWLSRRVVRYIWRPLQQAFGLNLNHASGDAAAYRDRDHYLFEWANAHRLLLVAGHTHRALLRPFFLSDQFRLIQDRLVRKLSGTSDPYLRDRLSSTIERLNRLLQSPPDDSNPATNYFNEGCCVHTDGLTGIEIEQGEVRLIRWKNSQPGVNPRHVVQSSDLGAILARL